MTRSINDAHGDARAPALYVGRCCELLVGASACLQEDIATSSCSAIVRRAHNFVGDRLCRAGGRGYDWRCSCPCDAEVEAIFQAFVEGREMSGDRFRVPHDDDDGAMTAMGLSATPRRLVARTTFSAPAVALAVCAIITTRTMSRSSPTLTSMRPNRPAASLPTDILFVPSLFSLSLLGTHGRPSAPF
ncbi:hypothetical protein psal_cds_324 [Pandoravirus salinus]|uniref:Uncharacterized protein n=1 Tax=Pandoravirus salinus TaxID=1349410 RepID=S4W0P8_9VIRU|nr:hypothetical protein psal_cds_324 [Pandoravirus salinus]AGO83952.1 hypothetical protein psal_cds_324 [Pandoravirus salinus]